MTDPDPPKNGTYRLVPSGSTISSGVGGAVAVIIVAVFHVFGINFPAGVEASIAVVITAIAGYIPPSGRR